MVTVMNFKIWKKRFINVNFMILFFTVPMLLFGVLSKADTISFIIVIFVTVFAIVTNLIIKFIFE